MSQAASSASNFLLVVAVARVESPRAFGGFALAYAAFLLIQGAVRGLLGEVLAVEPREEVERGAGAPGRAIVGAASVIGVITGFVMAGSGLIVGTAEPVGLHLIAFGLGLPVLVAQDAARHVGFARGEPWWAARSDGVWLGVQVVVTLAVLAVARPAGWHLVLVWAFSAGCGWVSVAAAIGRPSPVEGLRWAWQRRSVGGPYALEFLVGPGSNHAVVYVVGGIVGVLGAGALRAAQTIFGPLNTLLVGVQSVALPEAAQSRMMHGRAHLRQFVAQLAVGFTTAASVYGLAMLVLPELLGSALFGDSWSGAAVLVAPLALRFVFAAIARGPLLGLRAAGQPTAALRLQAVTGALSIILATLGAVLFGVRGAAFGLAGAHLVGAVLSSSTFYRVSSRSSQSGRVPSGGPRQRRYLMSWRSRWSGPR